MQHVEVVIVGGGIAGASLAAALAGDGRSVLVLEASEEYRDRVRGESMVPWGVREARELGVEQALLDAGAHVTPVWHQYDPAVPADVAASNPIPAGVMVPDIPGSLNLRHPDACQALIDLAAARGAEVRRGVSEVEVVPGAAPAVRYAVDGARHEVTARLVVGADGRNSQVRKESGIPLQRQEEVHMVAGLLLGDVQGLPDHTDFLAFEGDLFMAGFQQNGGRMRLYLCPGVSEKHRFSGPGGLEEFRRSSAFSCLPFGDSLPKATPIGPLATYPGDDSWAPVPYADGVVLIGDAAGYNDPIIGQGLSISMRDARSVRDAVRDAGPGTGGFDTGAFQAYAAERLERMRRVRYVATLMSASYGHDPVERDAVRRRMLDLQAAGDPLFMGMIISVFAGPETGPADAFDGRLLAQIRGGELAAT